MVLQSLPVYRQKHEIIAALRERQVVIVAGETGSGKSICLPFICREAGFGHRRRIAVTQPRRIAAVSLAAYGAECSGTPPGELVGYRVRYRHSARSSTRIIYMTDGVLLASLAGDRRLMQYDTVIIDEAHERSVTIDFLTGYMRTLLPQRPDLHLIIASATADTRLYSRMFDHAPVITVSGRRFSVDLRYQPVIALWKGVGIDSFIEGAIRAVDEIGAESDDGDMLVFMPTVDDVMETTVRLRRRFTGKNVTVLPLHSRLGMKHQKEVFASFDGRKIVVATNIAETSLTVPGIRYVIDTGLARVLRYDPGSGIARMPVERISRASADQRCGRCGRERDGVCIRLYTEQEYLGQPRFTPPEIRRVSLAGILLKMRALQLGEPSRFPFPQRPAPAAVAEGYQLLRDIGALDKTKQLTSEGKAMARFPLDPPVACMLLKAKSFGVLPEVAVIAAALSAQDPLAGGDGEGGSVPGPLRYPGSDFLTCLNIWNRLRSEGRGSGKFSWKRLRTFCERYGFQPMRIREWIAAFGHIRRIGDDMPGYTITGDVLPRVSTARADAIHKSLLSGLVHGVAVRKGSGGYEGIGGVEIRIASSSVTFRKRLPWLLFHGIVDTGRVYGARAAAINPKWIEELFPQQCSYRHEDPAYDPVSGRVLIREEVRFRSLTLISNRKVDCATVDRTLANEVFIREALVGERIGERYRFIVRNRATREDVTAAEKKLRRPLYAGVGALTDFYRERVAATSRREFSAFIREQGGDAFLMVPIEQLLVEPLPDGIQDYADTLTVASYRLGITWKHAEDAADDGATVTVPQRLSKVLPGYYWEWLLPVLVRLRNEALVTRLTREVIAKDADPADAVDALNELPLIPYRSYSDAVVELLESGFGVPGESTRLVCTELPAYLWLRVTIADAKGVGLEIFRPPFTKGHSAGTDQSNVATVLSPLADGLRRNAPAEWVQARLLEPVCRSAVGQQVPCVLYPALHHGGNGVGIELFTDYTRAITVHADALRRLCYDRVAEEMAWTAETIRLPDSLQRLSGVSMERLRDAAITFFERYVCELPDELPRTPEQFERMVVTASERIAAGAGMVTMLFEQTFAAIDRCRTAVIKRRHRYAGSRCEPLHRELEATLDRYEQALFSTTIGIPFLVGLPDWIDVFPHRGAAAFLDTAKYRVIMREVHLCEETIDRSEAHAAYPMVTARERLRVSVERYIAGQFSGGSGTRERKVTADDLARQRERLEKMLEE